MNKLNKVLIGINKLNISKSNLNRYLKNHYPHVYKYITSKTIPLINYYKEDNIPILAKLYTLENNITTPPKCKVCGKPVRFINREVGFAKWCSISCSCKDQETINKSKATRLERYGDENYHNIEKSKTTRNKKLLDNPEYKKDIVRKTKATKLKRYGDEKYTNPEKMKQTKLEKYGNASYNNMDKNKQTKLERYGDEKYNNRNKFKLTLSSFSKDRKNNINQKRKKTNLGKYGVESYTQTKEYLVKTKHTNLEKYGVECILQLNTSKQRALEYNLEYFWSKINQLEKYIPLFSFEEYKIGRKSSNNRREVNYKWQCKNCGTEFYAAWVDGHINKRCPNCEPKLNIVSQTNLYNFIIENYKGEVIQNTKQIISHRELDIYIPDKKLAIEYDGIYWHSDNRKSRTYHLDKTEACEKKDIQLIHIFEDEWTNKQTIVKNRLATLLGNYDKKIYARKCMVKEVPTLESKNFLDDYHIQGAINAHINLGLYFDNELVALMTFSKARFNSHYEYELLRYCTKGTCHIIGGAGKLLKYFERNYNPKSLISYADRRWSMGKLYTTLGFNCIGKTPPNYWYFKKGKDIRESRVKYQKHKLAKLLENFDPNLSEAVNMENNGYERIYDCGNLVFVKNYS